MQKVIVPIRLGGEKLDHEYLISSKSMVQARLLPPGDYVIIRPTCVVFSSGNKTYYRTRPQDLTIFGEFTVEAGKANYIGALTIGMKGSSNNFFLEVDDKSEAAEKKFISKYEGRVGEFQVKLAKTLPPYRQSGITDKNREKLMLELAKIMAKQEQIRKLNETEKKSVD